MSTVAAKSSLGSKAKQRSACLLAGTSLGAGKTLLCGIRQASDLKRKSSLLLPLPMLVRLKIWVFLLPFGCHPLPLVRGTVFVLSFGPWFNTHSQHPFRLSSHTAPHRYAHNLQLSSSVKATASSLSLAVEKRSMCLQVGHLSAPSADEHLEVVSIRPNRDAHGPCACSQESFPPRHPGCFLYRPP